MTHSMSEKQSANPSAVSMKFRNRPGLLDWIIPNIRKSFYI